MENTYLIPANSKKSMLIFGFFKPIDMGIFCSGIGISFLMLMFMPVEEFWAAILAMLPGFICIFLVFPIPNYHNVRTVIMNAWKFYMTRQSYIWKGWCYEDGERNQK